MSDDTHALLKKLYRKFCKDNALPQVSADEQNPCDLTEDQTDWLVAFMKLWEIETNQMNGDD